MKINFTETVKKQQKKVSINNFGGYSISIWNKEPTLVKNNFKIVNNRLLLCQKEIEIPDNIELPVNMLLKHLSDDLEINGLLPIDESMIKLLQRMGMDIGSLVS